jgi:hypothetical protein
MYSTGIRANCPHISEEKIDRSDNENKRATLIVILPRGYPDLQSNTEEKDLNNKFDDCLNYEIKVVRHLNRKGKGRQVAEVTFGSGFEAGLIRKRFVQRVQTQPDWICISKSDSSLTCGITAVSSDCF